MASSRASSRDGLKPETSRPPPADVETNPLRPGQDWIHPLRRLNYGERNGGWDQKIDPPGPAGGLCARAAPRPGRAVM